MKTRSFLGWFGRTPRSEVKASAEPRVAEREDAESQYEQGQRFERGAGVSQDEARAIGYYLKAGVQGHAAAPFNLGLMCVQGRGVSRNEASAQQWLRQAAEQGHPGAQYHLGVILYRASKRLPEGQASEARIEGFKCVQLALGQWYRGAESALEFIALGMTRQEVQEGGCRAAAEQASRPAGMAALIHRGLAEAGLKLAAAFFLPGWVGLARDKDGLVEDKFAPG